MRIGVPAREKDINSKVDDRFARCKYILVYEDGKEEWYNNEVSAAHGAGPQMVNFLMQKKVDSVIAPQVGENARQALKSAGIRAYYSQHDASIKENINLLIEGKLKEI